MTDEPMDVGANSAPDEICITAALARRPSHAPDHVAEAQALGALARDLAADPRGSLQKIADTAMLLCRADSAAVGIVESDGDGATFRWHAVAGAYPPSLAGRIPIGDTPVGIALRSGVVELFERTERQFDASRASVSHVHESLVAPWRIDGRAAGTLCVFAQHVDRQFDAEDARLLLSLADFASAAWQTVSALDRHGRVVAESATTRTALRRQLTLAEEDERRRLARELHDEVGQHLTALGLGLQALSDVAPPGSDVDRRATQLRGLTDTLGRELHALAVRLRPRALDDFGLEAALQSYAEEWTRQSGIAIDVHARGPSMRLLPSAESAVYRIVQEALTNVARHSGAAHAGVVLERRDGYIHLAVEDDGRGFDPDRAAMPDADRLQRLGLVGMRERAALVGGTMDIESAPGKGTTVFVRFPIAGALARHVGNVVAERPERRADV
jgi:signal transduction histidine kinase